MRSKKKINYYQIKKTKKKRKYNKKEGGTNVDEEYCVKFHLKIGDYYCFYDFINFPKTSVVLRLLNNIYQKNNEKIFINGAEYRNNEIYFKKIKLPFSNTQKKPYI